VKLHVIRLLGVPVAVHRRAAEHSDAINRELTLIATADDGSVPARLQALSERLTARYSSMTSEQAEQLQEAFESRRATIDLEYELPAEVADACVELEAMLDEVDEYCREGNLMSLISPPEAVAYRKWYLGEFVRQVRGEEPTPWPGFDPADGATDAAQPPRSRQADEVVEVSGALDLEGASKLRPEVAARLESGRYDLVFDLTDCDFVDSVGMSLLLTTRTRCLEQGGSLRVANLQPFVRTTFTHAGVLTLLTDGTSG
jgi:anti-anti-sigma factor